MHPNPRTPEPLPRPLQRGVNAARLESTLPPAPAQLQTGRPLVTADLNRLAELASWDFDDPEADFLPGEDEDTGREHPWTHPPEEGAIPWEHGQEGLGDDMSDWVMPAPMACSQALEEYLPPSAG